MHVAADFSPNELLMATDKKPKRIKVFQIQEFEQENSFLPLFPLFLHSLFFREFNPLNFLSVF
ncbi:MAG TPA: hypothetical protein DCP79_00500 [Prevotella sp.]|nr:hypothetical protein [Prevotella sp.]